MRISTRWLRVATLVVPVSVSALVLVVVAGALPAPAAWAVVGIPAVTAASLLAGAGEGVACRVLLGGRAPTVAEAAVLAPAVTLACRAGWGPPLVEVRVRPHDGGLGCAPYGYRTVVVPYGLVAAMQRGAVSPSGGAASLVHAAAVTRAGHTAAEPAVQVWCLPWALIRAAVGVLGRVRVLRLAWQVRLVVVTAAVAQQLTGGHTVLGLGLAAGAALTYLVPAAGRARSARVVAVGDDAVAACGWGRDYLGVLQGAGTAVTVERRARLSTGPAEAHAAGAGPALRPAR